MTGEALMYESTFHTVVTAGEKACVLTRSATPFCALADVEEEYEHLTAVLDRLQPVRVLVDLRSALGRNDAAFESTLAPHRKRILSLASSTTILVSTAVGELQVARLVALDGLSAVYVTRSLEDARRRLGGE